MLDVDTGGADRLAVVVQYRMATTEQVHLLVAPGVRIEQTRRRLAKLRAEGLVDRLTAPRAGRTRVWFASRYGVEVASEWPELREWRPPRLVSDRTAARLRVGHTLTVTETGLAFVQDARQRGEVCRPMDWIPEVYHPLGNGEAVIPDALLYYRRSQGGGGLLWAFVEVDRATMGPERLAAKLTVYARLHRYAPAPVARPPHTADGGEGELEAPLQALPAVAVRPRRHRPGQHQHAHERPERRQRVLRPERPAGHHPGPGDVHDRDPA